MLVSANEGGLEDSDVGWFSETAYCSTSHDSSCCAYQMLITECVTSQPEACDPWLQKVIDVGSCTTSENLFKQWQDFFPVLLSTNLLVWGHSCVSSHIVSSENPRCVSDRPRQVCCHFKRQDFVFENCQIQQATHCGDGFLRGSIALMVLCR